MGLRIAARQSGDVMILDLVGRATLGAENDALKNQLMELTQAGTRKFLINLAEVSQIDSSGISTLVHYYVSLQRAGGSLKLVGPSGYVREALEVTHLDRSIPVFENESQALASFERIVGNTEE